jgi:riboflavin biosynthesis pyrimidine reductase
MGAASFAARLREVYREDPAPDGGVVHVTSVWAAPDGSWRSIRIGASSPHSATDAFVLDAARARADAIVTTGAILRAEPALVHTLSGDAAAWRAERLGKSRPPTIVVLTRRADLDLEHAVFTARTGDAIIATTPDAATALRSRAPRPETALRPGQAPRPEVAARDRTGLRDVVTWLRAERGCGTVLVEAGVTSARTLYEAPCVVDELLLSLYSGPLAEVARGETFLPRDEPLRLALAAAEGRAGQGEAEGPEHGWRFARHRLAALVSAET